MPYRLTLILLVYCSMCGVLDRSVGSMVVAAAVMVCRQRRGSEPLLSCTSESKMVDEEPSLVKSPRKIFDGRVQYAGRCIQQRKTSSVRPVWGPGTMIETVNQI